MNRFSRLLVCFMNSSKRIFISALLLSGLVASSSSMAGDNWENHNSKHKRGERMEVCRLKSSGTYKLLNLPAKTALKRLMKNDKYFLPNENGTCEFEPLVDWGTCPCVEEGGPWQEAFGLPENDRNIASIIRQDFPPIPTTWIPFDADGNTLGEITLYGGTGVADPIFLFCGAFNVDFEATDLFIEYDDNDEAVDEIRSCSNGLQQAFGSDQ